MLKTKAFTAMMVLVLAILPAIAMGKDIPSGKWWHDPRVSEQLDLSEAEKARLDEEFRNSHRKLIDLKSSVERERFELENLLERQVLNEAAVMEQFKRLEKARTNLAAERFSFLLQVRKILGSERFQRVKMVHRKLRHHRMHRNKEGIHTKDRP